MSKLNKEQQDEITRCVVDFPYFCEKYIQILSYDALSSKHTSVSNSKIIPFKLWPHQLRLYEHLENNRFTIFSKFRLGGFSTLLGIYGLWKCLFRFDQNILWLSKSDHEAMNACDGLVKRAIEYLPDWMKGEVM